MTEDKKPEFNRYADTIINSEGGEVGRIIESQNEDGSISRLALFDSVSRPGAAVFPVNVAPGSDGSIPDLMYADNGLISTAAEFSGYSMSEFEKLTAPAVEAVHVPEGFRPDLNEFQSTITWMPGVKEKYGIVPLAPLPIEDGEKPVTENPNIDYRVSPVTCLSETELRTPVEGWPSPELPAQTEFLEGNDDCVKETDLEGVIDLPEGTSICFLGRSGTLNSKHVVFDHRNLNRFYGGITEHHEQKVWRLAVVLEKDTEQVLYYNSQKSYLADLILLTAAIQRKSIC